MRKAYNRAKGLNKKSKEIEPTCIITRFNTQHKEIRNILEHHWPLLRLDQSLSKYVTPHLQITYRRAHSLKDKLVQSHSRRDHKIDPCHDFGTYPCGSCRYCNFLDKTHKRKNLIVSDVELKLHHYANCNTKRVVYLLMCKFGAFYVDLTKLCGKYMTTFMRWKLVMRNHQ